MDLEFVCMGVYVGGFQVRTRKQGMTSFGSLADWQIARFQLFVGWCYCLSAFCFLFFWGGGGVYVCPFFFLSLPAF